MLFPRVKKHLAACFVVGVLLGYEIISHTEEFFHPERSFQVAWEEHGLDHETRKELVGVRGTSAHDDENSVVKFEDKHQHRDDDSSVADDLYKRVRVTCLVLTSSREIVERVAHIQQSWGTRCNTIVYASDKEASGLNVLLTKARDITGRTTEALKHVYTNYGNVTDWVITTDDITYVIVENLRYLVSAHSPSSPVYIGDVVQNDTGNSIINHEAGFVLSSEALKRFATNDASAECEKVSTQLSQVMSRCFSHLGLHTANSKDKLNRSRFHVTTLQDRIEGKYPKWYEPKEQYRPKGMDTVSDYPVTFGRVIGKQMYVMEFLVYHASVYGIIRGIQDINPTLNSTVS